MTNKILILGSQGQLGKAFCHILKDRAIGLDRNSVNFARPDLLIPILKYFKIMAVINCAAYTAVDLAEQQPELVNLINAESPKKLAEFCAFNNLPFIHFSSDYVFNGKKQEAWTEDDQTDPLSVYGLSKLKAEQYIKQIGDSYLIFRTSWLYGSDGKNFLNTMLNLAGNQEILNVVADQIGAPTYVFDLAKACLLALDNALACRNFPSGIYHLTNNGEASWYQFAKSIFDLTEQPLKLKQLNPIATKEYPTPATRPLNSRLNNSKIFKALDVKLPNWQQSLAICMKYK